ncbi:MAG: hypothetical protein D6714_21095 [Bacteroidetes bacterium]|nr:MAG: hypothetical protein D6714_21095 [Bacteroidota bacterium]
MAANKPPASLVFFSKKSRTWSGRAFPSKRIVIVGYFGYLSHILLPVKINTMGFSEFGASILRNNRRLRDRNRRQLRHQPFPEPPRPPAMKGALKPAEAPERTGLYVREIVWYILISIVILSVVAVFLKGAGIFASFFDL